jgi:hypothetical protein
MVIIQSDSAESLIGHDARNSQEILFLYDFAKKSSATPDGMKVLKRARFSSGTQRLRMINTAVIKAAMSISQEDKKTQRSSQSQWPHRPRGQRPIEAAGARPEMRGQARDRLFHPHRRRVFADIAGARE